MINIILFFNVIIFLCIGSALLNHRKQLTVLREKMGSLEHSMEQVVKDHPVLVNADLVFAKQIREINAQLISMDNQLQDLENKRDNDGGYQHALRILEMGGDRDEIVSSCHLSNAEAELLMNLHAYRSALKTA